MICVIHYGSLFLLFLYLLSLAAMDAAGNLAPVYPEIFSKCLVQKLSKGLESGRIFPVDTFLNSCTEVRIPYLNFSVVVNAL